MDGPVGSGVAYIRVSKNVQQNERQKSTISEWAARHGVTVARQFEDSGSRDKSEDRADFQRLLEFVRRGKVAWVVVEDLDRFGIKDAYELASYIYELRKHGTQLWTVSGDECISEGSDHQVLINVIGGMASEKEQYAKGERAISAKMQQARMGTWVGGYVPYGLDVVCVREGVEQWRLVFEGRDKRLQIVGGQEVRWDGKGNVPSHAKHVDVLHLTPSIRTERMDLVREVFTAYAEEAISFGKIAKRLNDRGIPSGYGKPWYPQLIEHMLENPVYVGLPTFNKNAHSRFYQYVDGKISKAPRKHHYKAVVGRKRDKADWIAPEAPLFDPIVPVELFERVQSKLAARKAGKRAPKSDALWLSGLVYCGHCGLVMAGGEYATQTGDQRSYLCQTAQRYGSGVASTGCRSHRVRHVVLEEYMDRCLADLETELVTIRGEEDRAFDSHVPHVQRLFESGFDLHDRVREFLENARGAGSSAAREGLDTLAGLSPLHESIFEIYREVYEERRPLLEAQVAEANAELLAMVDGFAGITSPRAREIANARMHVVEERIAALEADLLPLDDLRRAWQADFREFYARIEETKRALHGSDLRRKAEAIRKVISKITCHFDYVPHGQQTRSVLREVEITTLGNEISPVLN